MAAMRIALVLVLSLVVAACGKKKSPQAPAPDTTESQLKQDREEKDSAAPAEEDDAPARSSDPQEGGE
jgi:negative regulator of sigma E activity